MTQIPQTDGLWARLSTAAREAVAAIDAERLETERARVSAARRGSITEPVYTVRKRFAAWESLIRILESGPDPDGFYPFSAYENDLDNRDSLEDVLARLPVAVRAELAEVLALLDARFTAATNQDVTGQLDPWLRNARGRAPAEHGWWWRVPKAAPWQG
ncbi:hypothetical protein [Streptomyces sp. NPDC058304]|uniref:hypothetical protein n=1 Tax=Streptomyces sp. NPDC058304 TaxID=3346437 RepID=UPI0036E3F53A